jgi:hypothetical protein
MTIRHAFDEQYNFEVVLNSSRTIIINNMSNNMVVDNLE